MELFRRNRGLTLAMVIGCWAGGLSAQSSAGDGVRATPVDRAEPREHPGNDLSRFAESLREALGVPGVSIAARNSDGPLAWGVAGVRSSRGTDPIQRDDRFHIGSLTKSMTATLVAKHVEAGELEWDSTIAQIDPELAAQIPERARAVTVRQLLSHRAGLSDDRHGMGMVMKMWSLPGTIIEQRAEAARLGLNAQGNREPGTEFVYSNMGYVVAGHLLEVITGESWEMLIERELFEPLGLDTAGQGPPGLDPEGGAQPFGHGGSAGAYTPIPQRIGADNPPPLGPAGRVHMSARDLASYAAVHLRGLLGQDSIIDAGSFRILHADPESDGYALGWGVQGQGPTERSLHAGSNTRWFALMMVWPARDIAVVVCMNAVPAEGRAGDLLGAFVDELERLGMIGPLPEQAAESTP